MNLRNTVHEHNEPLWILALDQNSIKNGLPPTADMIDWYHNQLIAKSIKSGHTNLSWGDQTLIPTTGLANARRLLVFGLGEQDNLTPSIGRKLAQTLDEVLKGLGEENPWIVLPPTLSEKFMEEFEKSRTSSQHLVHAKISR